jgi:hypothetical protein
MGGTGQVVGVALAALSLLALAAFGWQHARYLHERRTHVQDRQPVLYGASAFHVVTLGKLAPGADLFAATRRLVGALEAAGARAVYAGKRLVIGQQARQTPDVEWDFALLCQYASRAAYEAALRRPDVAGALAGLEARYDLGMRRPVLRNLLLPGLLLLRRVADVLRRAPSGYPFVRDEAPERMRPERTRIVEELRKESDLGRDAVAVVNFVLPGTREQQASDAGYVSAMMGLMAERGYGPMHIGRAVTVEGDARFERVAIVYYPGAGYFADMAESAFFGGIIGGKQLGDNLSMITAPYLDRL